MKKKCKTCKAEMKTYTTYEGKRYNTVNRVYCMECSPPKIKANVAENIATNSDTIYASNQVDIDDLGDGCLDCERLKRIISALMKELL